MDIIELATAALSFTGNCFVLSLLFSCKLLHKDKSFRFIAALSTADLLIAISSFVPEFLGILTYFRTGNRGDYEMLNIALPYVGEIKMHSVMVIACASDRISAMYWPVEYKMRSKKKFAIISLLIGVVWALFEVAFLILTTESYCSQTHCFFNGKYYFYSIISDIIMNFVSLFLTALVLVKNYELKNVHPHSVNIPLKSWNSRLTISNQANQLFSRILLCSGVCIFFPSCIAACKKFAGLTVPENNGSIISVGLLLSGIGHSIIFIQQHNGIELMWKKMVSKCCFWDNHNAKNCEFDKNSRMSSITVISTPSSTPRILIRAPSEENAPSCSKLTKAQVRKHNSTRELPALSPLHQASFDPTLLSAMDAKKPNRMKKSRPAPYIPQLFLG